MYKKTNNVDGYWFDTPRKKVISKAVNECLKDFETERLASIRDSYPYDWASRAITNVKIFKNDLLGSKMFYTVQWSVMKDAVYMIGRVSNSEYTYVWIYYPNGLGVTKVFHDSCGLVDENEWLWQ